MNLKRAYGVMEAHFKKYDHEPEVNEAFKTIENVIAKIVPSIDKVIKEREITMEIIKKYLEKKGKNYIRKKPSTLEVIPVGSIALVKYPDKTNKEQESLYKNTHCLLKCHERWMEPWGSFKKNTPTKAFFRTDLSKYWEIKWVLIET